MVPDKILSALKKMNKIMTIDFFSVFALVILLWMAWLLVKAKRFTQFKQQIEVELKPKVIADILANLEETRSKIFPNNEVHQQATIYYWTQYKARILQAALQREIISQQWLKDTGNLRNSQHLFHIEQQYLD
jgi:Glu-tRNA(Gln) amidotransferase subunit E-like FAD-binding protein